MKKQLLAEGLPSLWYVACLWQATHQSNTKDAAYLTIFKATSKISLMSVSKEIGEVEQMPFDIKHFEWRISNFSAIYEDQNIQCYKSPFFSFAGNLWQLLLCPNVIEKRMYIDLKLAEKNVMEQFFVEYCFGLKKYDGKVDRLITGYKNKDSSSDFKEIVMKKSELLARKAKFMPNNILTIVFTIKSLIKTKPLEFKGLDKLSECFKYLFDNKEACDVTLKVKNKNYVAHKTVLIARSSIFAATFKHDTLENQTSIVTIRDCDPDSFQEFLEYLYCGKLESLSWPTALNLYYTSDKYEIVELKAFCIESLMQCLTTENICEILVFADKYDEVPLLSAIQDFFNKNATDILITSKWECFLKKHFRLANKLLVEMSKNKQ